MPQKHINKGLKMMTHMASYSCLNAGKCFCWPHICISLGKLVKYISYLSSVFSVFSNIVSVSMKDY